MLVLMKSLSYTPDASFSEEFLLHPSGYDKECFTPMMLFLVRSFCNTPDASFSEEFLLDS